MTALNRHSVPVRSTDSGRSLARFDLLFLCLRISLQGRTNQLRTKNKGAHLDERIASRSGLQISPLLQRSFRNSEHPAAPPRYLYLQNQKAPASICTFVLKMPFAWHQSPERW